MKYLLIIVSVFILSSCGKEEVDGGGIETETYADDTFIFGHFYGECVGENCIEVFKIEDGKLYEDTTDAYPDGTDDNFTWVQLSDDKFDLVKLFPDFFPNELLDETEIVLGQPDAGDWGGYVIGKTDQDELRMWLIDTADDNLPEYLHDYNDRIGFMISLL